MGESAQKCAKRRRGSGFWSRVIDEGARVIQERRRVIDESSRAFQESPRVIDNVSRVFQENPRVIDNISRVFHLGPRVSARYSRVIDNSARLFHHRPRAGVDGARGGIRGRREDDFESWKFKTKSRGSLNGRSAWVAGCGSG